MLWRYLICVNRGEYVGKTCQTCIIFIGFDNISMVSNSKIWLLNLKYSLSENDVINIFRSYQNHRKKNNEGCFWKTIGEIFSTSSLLSPLQRKKEKEKENLRRNTLLTLFLLRNSEADFVVKNKSIGLLRNMGRIKKICEPSWVILIENRSHSFFRLIGQAFWEPEMESIWTFTEGYQMEPYHVTLNSSFCHNVPIVSFGGILLQTQETIFFL